VTVWLIQIGEPLPVDNSVRKMRTALVAEEFIRRGWKVKWFTSTFDHQKKKWINENPNLDGLPEDCEIIYLKGRGYKRNISAARFYDHRLVARDFKNKVKQLDKPDLIVASMPTYDLSYQSLLYAKKNNTPIYIDVRDRWPDVFFEFAPRGFKALLKTFFATEYRMLSYQLKQADGLISMMNPMMDWALDIAGRSKTERDNVFFLGADKMPSKINDSAALEERIKLNDGRKTISFIGTFGNYNNPEIICNIARNFSPKKYKFVIAGNGDYFDRVKNAAKGLEHVLIPGWLNQDEIHQVLKASSIAVLPMSKNVAAFPNKAFVYLSAHIPIIASCPGDMKSLLNKYKAGLYFEPGDEEGLICCLRLLLENDDIRKEYCEGAKRLFNEKLDSEVIYKNYVDHVTHHLQGK
jgi:glycosyltransferase involved in cell wall biosynthesis